VEAKRQNESSPVIRPKVAAVMGGCPHGDVQAYGRTKPWNGSVRMSNESSPPIVTQLRLVVEVDDFDEAVYWV